MMILENLPNYPKTIEDGLKKQKEEMLKTGKGEAKVAWKVLNDASDIAHELNDYAVKHKKDLIVIGTKGKSSLDRFIIGSVSTRLAHHAEVPILIAR